jgi:hypothetical protein
MQMDEGLGGKKKIDAVSVREHKQRCAVCGHLITRMFTCRNRSPGNDINDAPSSCGRNNRPAQQGVAAVPLL